MSYLDFPVKLLVSGVLMTSVAWSSRIDTSNKEETEHVEVRVNRQAPQPYYDDGLFFRQQQIEQARQNELERQKAEIEKEKLDLQTQKLELEKQKMEVELQRLQQQLLQQQAATSSSSVTFAEFIGTGLQVMGEKLSGSEDPKAPSKWVPIRDSFLKQFGFKK